MSLQEAISEFRSKEKYDPENFFRVNRNIRPAAWSADFPHFQSSLEQDARAAFGGIESHEYHSDPGELF